MKWSDMHEQTGSKVPLPVNAPHLMRLVSVMVIRSFCLGGRPLAIGDEVRLEYATARDLIFLGKAQMLTNI